MATVTFGVTTWTTSVGNKTAALTPAVGDLLIVFCGTGQLSANPPTNVTDNQGGTYTNITGTVGVNGNAGRINAWVRNQLVSSAVSHTLTSSQATSTGGGLVVYRVAGITRASLVAIRSFGTQAEQAAGTPAPVLSQTPLTENVIIGCVNNATNPAGMTARTNFTEGQDSGYGSPTTGIETMYRNSGETTATQTWGSASASLFNSIVLEIDSSAFIAFTNRHTPILVH